MALLFDVHFISVYALNLIETKVYLRISMCILSENIRLKIYSATVEECDRHRTSKPTIKQSQRLSQSLWLLVAGTLAAMLTCTLDEDTVLILALLPLQYHRCRWDTRTPPCSSLWLAGQPAWSAGNALLSLFPSSALLPQNTTQEQMHKTHTVILQTQLTKMCVLAVTYAWFTGNTNSLNLKTS